MAFGRAKNEASTGTQVTALVLAADQPVDNASRWSNVGRGTVEILADTASGQVHASRRMLLDEDHWLVPGVRIPVSIDPAAPNKFDIDWEAIPSIEERAAANDPSLADPRAAARFVNDARRAAGLWGPALTLPDPIRDRVTQVQEAQKAATPDRFAESMAKAEHEPAPPGKQRAVVLIATIAAHLIQSGGDNDGGGGTTSRSTSGKRRAVLSVNVPGQAPYAVFVRKFDNPARQADIASAGLPAVVSLSDPHDVEVLWNELPSVGDQLNQRIADGMHAAQAGIAQSQALAQQAMKEAMQQAATQQAAMQQAATPDPPDANSAAAAMGQMPQMPPAMQAMVAQNARAALQYVKDPAMRAMMIQQYRAAGIPIEDDQAPG